MSKAAWTPQARRDLDRLHDWYSELSPDFAERGVEATFAAARFLAEHPLAGPSFGSQGARKWLVRKAPFILLYRVARGGVEVLRVVDARSEWRGLV